MNLMKRIHHFNLLSILLPLALAIACGPADELSSPELIESEPAENMTPVDVDTDVSGLAQNCVYIQWCNQPNSSWGTVCVLRNTAACRALCNGGDALEAECESDARAVCGGVTLPADFRGC
jgi:hypothetical protein